MLMLYLIFILLIMLIYNTAIMMYKIVYKYKIENLIENIHSKEDLLNICYKDLPYLMIEIFRRKGDIAKITDKCGEEGNGLILNNLQMVEVWKHALNQVVEMESAMKLAKCMQNQSIYRGMIITLGDFKYNTRCFCHKNVITCINGEQFLALCKDAQKRKELLQCN